MQLAAAAEQRLGPEDVGAAGQRAVGVAGWMLGHDIGDLGCHARLCRSGEAPWLGLVCDPVAAVVHDRGTGQNAQELWIEVQQPTDRAQLPARGRQRAEVAAVSCRGALKAMVCGGFVAAQQVRLRLGCRRVVGLVAGGEGVEHDGRKLSGASGVAGDQPQRGRVDRRVVAAGTGEHGGVGLGGKRGPAATFGSVRGQREILGDPRIQRCDVLVADAAEAELLEAASGLLGRSGAGEREHRSVLEPEIVWMLGQSAFGEIEGGQQLSASLFELDRVEPPGGRLLQRRCDRRLLRGPRHAGQTVTGGRGRPGVRLQVRRGSRGAEESDLGERLGLVTQWETSARVTACQQTLPG